MTRFLLDTGIAGLYLARKQGVFERAEAEIARGNRVGIAGPVLAELAFRAEGSPKRDECINPSQLARASAIRHAPDCVSRVCSSATTCASFHRFE